MCDIVIGDIVMIREDGRLFGLLKLHATYMYAEAARVNTWVVRRIVHEDKNAAWVEIASTATGLMLTVRSSSLEHTWKKIQVDVPSELAAEEGVF